MPKTDITLPTVEELRSWVEAKPEGSVIALTCSRTECLLANYLLEKYPHLSFGVEFSPVFHEVSVTVWERGEDEPDDDGDEQIFYVPMLAFLLEAFDNLAGLDCPVTREQVLTCFEENAHAETR